MNEHDEESNDPLEKFDPLEAADPVDEAIAEFLQAEDEGRPLQVSDWLDRFARKKGVREQLEKFVEDQNRLGGKFVDSRYPSQLEDTTDFTAQPFFSDTPDNPFSLSGPHTSPSRPPRMVGGIQLSRLLGAGGMGHVFAGIDTSGQAVAVKLLSPRWATSVESMERFRQEGAIASSINHPRCVFVRAADTDNGTPYIVMELMSGCTLKDLVKERGPLPFREALRLILDVAEGLQEAHQHGMIHRDVKPANCYLDDTGRVKVGDFGLARSMEDHSDLTSTGGFVGTPLFASPEQVKGLALDERTDVYSLTATPYFLLTGAAPFASEHPTQTIARIVSEDAKPPSDFKADIPAAVDRIVRQGLERDPSKRFQDMRELRRAVSQLTETKPLVSEIGKRIAAYFADVGIYSLTSLAILLSFGAGDLTAVGDGRSLIIGKNPLLYLVLLSLWFAYFFFTETLFCGSLGKRFMGLSILHNQTMEPVRWPHIFIRTLTFLCLGGFATDLLLHMFASDENPTVWLSYQWAGYGISIALLCSTIGLDGRRRLAHDWLSNTVVVSQKRDDLDQHLHREIPNWLPATSSSESWPTKIGRFKILRVLNEAGNKADEVKIALLLARDTSLNRSIWLAIAPTTVNSAAHNQTLSQPNQSTNLLARTSRLRLAQSGTFDAGQWHAFVAIHGAPLRHWVSPTAPFTWETTRAILSQWSHETLASQKENNSVHLISIDQIWLDHRGRLVLVDWPFDAQPSLLTPRDQVQDSLLIAKWIAQICLQGSHSEPPEMSPIRAVVPLHARNILDRLDGTLPPFHSTEPLSIALQESVVMPSRVGVKHRLLQFGIACLLMSPLIGASLSLSRIGNQVAIMETCDSIMATEAVQRLASNDAWFKQWQAALSGQRRAFTAEDAMAASDTIQSEALKLLEYRINHSGIIQQDILTAAGISHDYASQLPSMQFEIVSDQPFAVLVDDDHTQRSIRFSAIELADTCQRQKMIGDLTHDRHPWTLLVLAASPYILIVVWDAIFRGGFSAWLAGIGYVNRTGHRAERWRHALRSAALWLPAAAVTVAIAAVDVYFISHLPYSIHLLTLLLLLPLVFVAVSVYSPQRGLHDLLSGTFPVTR